MIAILCSCAASSFSSSSVFARNDRSISFRDDSAAWRSDWTASSLVPMSCGGASAVICAAKPAFSVIKLAFSADNVSTSCRVASTDSCNDAI